MEGRKPKGGVPPPTDYFREYDYAYWLGPERGLFSIDSEWLVVRCAARSTFDEEASDVDLLVQFEDMPHADRADAYLGFLTAVEALFQRPVDLVEVGAVRNPYMRRGIEKSRELVYAA